MKRLGTCLLAVIIAASFACETKEEKTTPAVRAAPAQPEKAEKKVRKRPRKGVRIDDRRRAEKREKRK